MKAMLPADIKAMLINELMQHQSDNGPVFRVSDVESFFDELTDKIENGDAPLQSRVLWSNMGHNADITFAGNHWTLRAFPGGCSVKCHETGAFHMLEAGSLNEAMLIGEEFVLGAAQSAESVEDPTRNTDVIQDASRGAGGEQKTH